MATVLVALAITDGSPSQISAGNESSVPPPATELMAPARKAAPKATAAWGKSSAAVKGQDSASAAEDSRCLSDKKSVDRFWQDAVSVFETARGALGKGSVHEEVAREDGASELNILIDSSGVVRIVAGEGWQPEALQAHYGARTVYQVTRTARGVRVTGRSGPERCVLESAAPAVPASIGGWAPYHIVEPTPKPAGCLMLR